MYPSNSWGTYLERVTKWWCWWPCCFWYDSDAHDAHAQDPLCCLTGFDCVLSCCPFGATAWIQFRCRTHVLSDDHEEQERAISADFWSAQLAKQNLDQAGPCPPENGEIAAYCNMPHNMNINDMYCILYDIYIYMGADRKCTSKNYESAFISWHPRL